MSQRRDMLVIVPSRGRPDNARRWVEDWKSVTCADLAICVDSDDPTLDEYPREHLVVGEPARFVEWTNRVAVPAARKYKAVASLTDKHTPRTPGWDVRILAALRDQGTGWVYPDDGLFHADIPTASFCSSDIVRALGFMLLPELTHMCCDNVVLAWGRAIGRIRYVPDVKIELLHAMAGTAPLDAVQQRSDERRGPDNVIYRDYLASDRFRAHVATLRTLLPAPGSQAGGESVCLALMCRDEAAGIARTLEQAKPLATTWCVLDTGSSDGTQDIVRETMRGIPGELHTMPWVDFGTCRTQLVTLARESGARWVLWIDADWRLAGSFHAPRADVGLVPVLLGDLVLRHALVLRASKPWRYRYPVHEMLECDEPYTELAMSGLRVVAGAYAELTQDADARRRARWSWDRDVIRQALEAAPDDARLCFNLGQTLRLLGDTQGAIDAYDRVVELSGGEEAWYAAYMSGALALPEHWQTSVIKLLAAWRMRPSRAEPLWELTAIFRQLRLDDVADYFEAERRKLRPPERERMVHLHAYAANPYVLPPELAKAADEGAAVAV